MKVMPIESVQVCFLTAFQVVPLAYANKYCAYCLQSPLVWLGLLVIECANPVLDSLSRSMTLPKITRVVDN
jgi:hypothetical protein